MPTLSAGMRAQALPADTIVVIRIAAGSAETTHAAAALTGRSPKTIVNAARFYLEQILFAPDADCIRILGGHAGSTREELREHLRWLMLWLHPDRNANEWESVFAERVIHAWQEARLLAPSRAQGDSGQAGEASPEAGIASLVLRNVVPARTDRPAPGERRQTGRGSQRWVALPLPAHRRRRRWGPRLAALVVAGIVGLTASFAALEVFWPSRIQEAAETAK
jgi:hypothetical protein